MNQWQRIVRSEVVGTSFGFYTDDELKALSVCHVTSSVVYDTLGTALPGGLSDARLGPTENRVICTTCYQLYNFCPGHPGHIELDVPVYHPLLFNNMFTLLRMKCSYCHMLKLSPERVRLYHCKLMLLQMGDVSAVEYLETMSLPSVIFEKDGKGDAEGSAATRGELEPELVAVERRYKRFVTSSGGNAHREETVHIKQLQRAVISSLQRDCTSLRMCENCATPSPVYRKDGITKIFRKPLSSKQRSAMMIKKRRLLSALEEDGGAPGDEEEDGSDGYSEEEEEERRGGDAKDGEMYLVPLEVEAQIKKMWAHQAPLLDFIWGRALGSSAGGRDPSLSWKLFFVRNVLVPPSRFRPSSSVGEVMTEHPQNVHLIKIMETNKRVRKASMEGAPSSAAEGGDKRNMSAMVSAWIDLQNSVNCYMDSSKDTNALGHSAAPAGIRQLLEKKEGLFRGNMMGKRVNYCCRSVISPDPYIGTNEIGVPVKFAKTLHYPVHVNAWNVKHLYQLVINGPYEYPGANQIETGEGHIIKLEKLSQLEREAKAKMLLTSPGNKVYRHLVDGDVLLVNRQPTLHKPGIMAHRARVLKHVKEQTLRMNYANCNSYNADFDGDEMNCHFVQDEISRAEANFIMNTDNQYIVPTSGQPLRGLIQDHVASGVKLTCKDTFLTRAEFQQLLYVAVSGFPGTEVVPPSGVMQMPAPAIVRPRLLWTGKQVVTALIKHLCRPPLPSLHLDGKTRTPPTAFGIDQNEHVVIFRSGELLQGVLDKASVGNVSLGIVHCVYELYGGELAGRLLNAFGRLFTCFLQDAGHSCGIADLILTSDADDGRRRLLEKVEVDAYKGLATFLHGGATGAAPVAIGDAAVEQRSRDLLQQQCEVFMTSNRKDSKVQLDGAMQGFINKSASDVIKACLPNGLQTPFLSNNFSMMVLTGAKGSAVNQSQISCFLGQQALEGQRVPIMISGKSLPSFRPYDGSPRAGGFVRDRFLTGIRPQEFYFHCMAGREGLVDTAVKTSRSGYLQRCLVKSLEELRVHYDLTVRDSANNIVQFLYGEDGLDPVHAGLLGGKGNQMLFLARNNQAFLHKYMLDSPTDANILSPKYGLGQSAAREHHEYVRRAREAVVQGAPTFSAGDVVLAKRKKEPDGKWEARNMMGGWHVAEVLKAKPKGDVVRYSIRYVSDGCVEKAKQSSGPRGRLLRAGLPDTALKQLRVDTDIGACSERVQNAIEDYISTNPDCIVSDDGQDNTVDAATLKLLLYVKYMKSMACPGEAVGCVAAQSVGEPSTQMTLNTFHLAGHGGANVTLGIPRLREIIMTASQQLKTPTMLVPLTATADAAKAKALARSLSRLSLSTLIHHNDGVEVRESVTGSPGLWRRRYCIRLNFQKASLIYSTFGISFDDIVQCVRKMFMTRLNSNIQKEVRRAGQEKVTVTSDAINQFRSNVKESLGDDVDEGRADDEDGAGKAVTFEDGSSSGASRKKNSAVLQLLDGDDGDDDDEDDEDDAEEGAKKIAKEEDDEGDIKDLIDWGDSDSELSGSVAGVLLDDDDDDDEGSERPQFPRRAVVNPDGSNDIMYDEANAYVELQLSFPASARRFLMVQIVEKAAEETTIRSTRGISNAYAMQTEARGATVQAVQTEGVNFEAIWSLPPSLIQVDEVRSNDIYQILLTYGVEAARQSIVSEIQGVFGVYGIDVNPRHLLLIADFMTRTGGFVPMNRNGMGECPSPFLQMSFETTCTFLTKAAVEGLSDNLQSPSGQIVMGNVARVGTGVFDIMIEMEARHKS